jgi:DNA-binding XRE family transcriptional regulator
VNLLRRDPPCQGRIPSRLISVLKEEYGDKVRLTPGKNLRIYRQNMSMTQSQLGKLLGNVPKQFISNPENGVRPISKKIALKLASIFDVSVARFIG